MTYNMSKGETMSKTQQQLDRELSVAAMIRSRIAKYDSDYHNFLAASKNPTDKFAQQAHEAKMNKLREQANLSAVNLQITMLQAKLEDEQKNKKTN